MCLLILFQRYYSCFLVKKKKKNTMSLHVSTTWAHSISLSKSMKQVKLPLNDKVAVLAPDKMNTVSPLPYLKYIETISVQNHIILS